MRDETRVERKLVDFDKSAEFLMFEPELLAAAEGEGVAEPLVEFDSGEGLVPFVGDVEFEPPPGETIGSHSSSSGLISSVQSQSCESSMYSSH